MKHGPQGRGYNDLRLHRKRRREILKSALAHLLHFLKAGALLRNQLGIDAHLGPRENFVRLAHIPLA